MKFNLKINYDLKYNKTYLTISIKDKPLTTELKNKFRRDTFSPYWDRDFDIEGLIEFRDSINELIEEASHDE